MNHRFWLFTLLFISNVLVIGPQAKPVIILKGCEVISCKELSLKVGFSGRKKNSKLQVRTIERRILNYYLKQGYKKARVKGIKAPENHIIFYIDEGRFNKIIFRNVNTLDLVKLNASFSLKPGVFHHKKLNTELERVKKRFNYKSITYLLEEVENKFDNPFQIGDLLKKTGLLQGDSPWEPSYNLIITIQKQKKIRPKDFYMGVRVNFRKGIIPYMDYKREALLVPDDNWKFELSMGFIYGLDLKFTRPPRASVLNVSSDYTFKSIDKDYFSLNLHNQFLRVRDIRRDIGLREYYETWIINRIDSQIKIFENFILNFGYGVQNVFLDRPEFTEEVSFNKTPLNRFIDEDGSFFRSARADFQFFEIGFKILLEKTNILSRSELHLNYNTYVGESTFNRLHTMILLDILPFKYGIWLIQSEFFYIFLSSGSQQELEAIPFYYENRIGDRRFKGLLGNDFHTRKSGKLANNYKFSIYKEFIYSGLYLDMALFEAPGYILEGLQFAIVVGLTLEFLVLDQLNFNIYFGRDYLISNSLSQFNFYIHAFIEF